MVGWAVLERFLFLLLTGSFQWFILVDIVAVNGKAFSGMDVGLPARLPVTGNSLLACSRPGFVQSRRIMKRYRAKYILEDGRGVYAGEPGVIAIYSEREFEKMPKELVAISAFSPDLKRLSAADCFAERNAPCVRVLRVDPEDASTPIDLTAFTHGGISAIEASVI